MVLPSRDEPSTQGPRSPPSPRALVRGALPRRLGAGPRRPRRGDHPHLHLPRHAAPPRGRRGAGAGVQRIGCADDPHPGHGGLRQRELRHADHHRPGLRLAAHGARVVLPRPRGAAASQHGPGDRLRLVHPLDAGALQPADGRLCAPRRLLQLHPRHGHLRARRRRELLPRRNLRRGQLRAGRGHLRHPHPRRRHPRRQPLHQRRRLGHVHRLDGPLRAGERHALLLHGQHHGLGRHLRVQRGGGVLPADRRRADQPHGGGRQPRGDLRRRALRQRGARGGRRVRQRRGQRLDRVRLDVPHPQRQPLQRHRPRRDRQRVVRQHDLPHRGRSCSGSVRAVHHQRPVLRRHARVQRLQRLRGDARRGRRRQRRNRHRTRGHRTRGHRTRGYGTRGHRTRGHRTRGHRTRRHGSARRRRHRWARDGRRGWIRLGRTRRGRSRRGGRRWNGGRRGRGGRCGQARRGRGRRGREGARRRRLVRLSHHAAQLGGGRAGERAHGPRLVDHRPAPQARRAPRGRDDGA